MVCVLKPPLPPLKRERRMVKAVRCRVQVECECPFCQGVFYVKEEVDVKGNVTSAIVRVKASGE